MRSSLRAGVPVGIVALLAAVACYAVEPGYAADPAFVQQVAAHGPNKASLAATLPAATVAGNRLVVEVGVWSNKSATASAVTDSAGDTFVKLLSFTHADHTEMSIWTAPAAVGGTTTVTAEATSAADLGVAVLEYSGMSTVAGASVVDQQVHATGTTSGPATVSSGATAGATADEIALGFYADSGFGDTLAAGSGWTQRASVASVGDMEVFAEDRLVPAGGTAAATFASGAATKWLAATVLLRPGSAVATAPGTPTQVVASPGNGSATVSWTAPGTGGSPITGYTVTPYLSGVAQPPIRVTGTAVTVTGLSDGSPYTFTVTATNGVGTGPASAPSAPVTPSSAPVGSWSALQTWPVVALSNTLLPDGTVLAWDGWQQPQPTVYGDPTSPQTFTTVNAPDSVFCDGAASLPDGRLLVVGGYGRLTTGQLGIGDTSIFDPVSKGWSRVADMHSARWYPTVTELADGRYLAVSGNTADATHWADTPEVYDPGSNTWTLLTGVATTGVHETEYPFDYLLPNGKVFVIGPAEAQAYLLDAAGTGTWAAVGGASPVRNGSSVMYRPGKVLFTGGGASVDNAGPSTDTAATIDLTAATPAWQTVAPMNNSRVYHTLTMLADGTVLAVGGSPTTDQHVITTGVLPAEIWNPDTGVWAPVASMAASRNYHSTALLMPDGRVLVAGGGHSFNSGDPGQYSAQFYSPPYLSAGPRPVIGAAPATTTYGATMTVSTPDAADIGAVNLVSLGADTHQIDMNQHFVPLSYTAASGSLSVQAPAGSADAPPGYYMVFLVNKSGVPSVASIVHLGAPATAPAVPTGVTATAGDSRATVSWSAPATGGSPITSYTVTPSVHGVAQNPVVVNGSPVPTTTTVTGLANGTAYTFTVRATNAVGTGAESVPSTAVTPAPAPAIALLQKVAAQTGGKSSLAVSMPAATSAGGRLVVQVGVWGAGGPTVSTVTDSAGDVFTKLLSFTANERTQMSVWTAPVSTPGGTPVITAKTTGTADIGVTAMEYGGLSTAAATGSVDRTATATGTTSGATTVGSGATAAVTGDGELAVGFYADSGFGHALSGGSGWTVRGNLSPNAYMDLLVEDQPVGTGATPTATVGTGPNTAWLVATVVFRHG